MRRSHRRSPSDAEDFAYLVNKIFYICINQTTQMSYFPMKAILFFVLISIYIACYSQETTIKKSDYIYQVLDDKYITDDLDVVDVSQSDFLVYCIKKNTIKKEDKYSETFKAWIYVFPLKGYYDKCILSLYDKYDDSRYLKFDMQKQLCYFDCQKDKICFRSIMAIDKGGNIFYDSGEHFSWEIVVPDTLGEDIFNYVCK